MGAINEGKDLALEAGVVPFAVLLVAMLAILALTKKVYPSLVGGAAAGVIAFLLRAG